MTTKLLTCLQVYLFWLSIFKHDTAQTFTNWLACCLSLYEHNYVSFCGCFWQLSDVLNNANWPTFRLTHWYCWKVYLYITQPYSFFEGTGHIQAAIFTFLQQHNHPPSHNMKKNIRKYPDIQYMPYRCRVSISVDWTGFSEISSILIQLSRTFCI